MKTIQKIIYAGFATCALASASMPALSWTVWPNVDFEWYADVGRGAQDDSGSASGVDVRVLPAALAVYPAPREGYIWSPPRYERVPGMETQAQLVPGQWIRDDYQEQVARYSAPGANQVAIVDLPRR